MIRNNIRLFYIFSTKNPAPKSQPAQQQPQNNKKDYDKSFDDFTKKYSIQTPDKVVKTQLTEKNFTIQEKARGAQFKSVETNISDQTTQTKNRLLSGKCKIAKAENQQYALLGRGEQVFLNNRKQEQEEKLINQQDELQRLAEGEEGVDFVMVPEEWKKQQYFAKSYGHRRIEEAYRQQENFPSLVSKTKYADIAEWRKMNFGFQPIEKQYESQPNLHYPGSINGPEPEDDPIAFRDWYVKSYPKKVVEEMYELASIFVKQDETVEQERVEGPTQIYTGAHEAVQLSTNLGLLENDVEGEMMSTPHQWVFRSIIKDNDIEPMPDKLPIEPIELFDQIEKWSHFRWLSLVVKCYDAMKTEGKIKNMPKITSLYPYYCTLPKFAREHPSVKIAYKNLEFKKFSIPIEEKERALNFICQAILEMDELTDSVCTSLAATRRHHPTVEDERILIHDNDRDIIDGYLNPLARDKYLATKPMYPPMEDQEGEYPYPQPQRFVTEKQDLTPVDYYDNDDGFWDDYIKSKHAYYIANHRPSTSRQFFKH